MARNGDSTSFSLELAHWYGLLDSNSWAYAAAQLLQLVLDFKRRINVESIPGVEGDRIYELEQHSNYVNSFS